MPVNSPTQTNQSQHYQAITDEESELIQKPQKWTIPDRKYALMQRDPLIEAFNKKFQEWLTDKNNTRLWDEIKDLEQQIEEKWQENIYIPESTTQGLTDSWFPVSRVIHESVKDARESNGILLYKIGKTFDTITYGFNRNGLIFCPSHKIPILIDPTVLTFNDIRQVKKRFGKS
jgi:hypothetical protein